MRIIFTVERLTELTCRLCGRWKEFQWDWVADLWAWWHRRRCPDRWRLI